MRVLQMLSKVADRQRAESHVLPRKRLRLFFKLTTTQLRRYYFQIPPTRVRSAFLHSRVLDAFCCNALTSFVAIACKNSGVYALKRAPSNASFVPSHLASRSPEKHPRRN